MAAVTGAYASLLERKWVEVRSISVSLPHVPPAFHGAKLIQFSDLHLGPFFRAGYLQPVVELILSHHPDLICFTGDLVDEGLEELADAVPILARLVAPMGKYAVLGNHDYRAHAEEVRRALESAGFRVLMNEHVPLQREGQVMYLAGVDDALNGAPDLSAALGGIPENSCVVLLAHEPDVAIHAAAHSVTLQLSGHSHGGQVRLPWWGHLITPPLARRYVDGLYRVEDSPMQLYVNRGLGTTSLPVRFFCRPELTVMSIT